MRARDANSIGPNRSMQCSARVALERWLLNGLRAKLQRLAAAVDGGVRAQAPPVRTIARMRPHMCAQQSSASRCGIMLVSRVSEQTRRVSAVRVPCVAAIARRERVAIMVGLGVRAALPAQARVCVAQRPPSRRHVCRAIPLVGEKNAFVDVKDEAGFFSALEAEVEAGRIPKQLVPLWTDFFGNYKKAILSAEHLPDHDMTMVAEVQAAIADTVINQLADPYRFPSFHKGITEPYDYFEFGQKYVGSLTDFSRSYLGHRERFDAMQRQLDAGDNVIILANHQSEADPGVWAHMLMHTHPKLAKEVIYVAGDRVVSDPLCVPFSMGRNLFCVHSKRYIDVDPDTKAEKSAMNRETLKNMGAAFAKGGTLVWIAPAGGRDRPNADGVYSPAAFDPGSVELMRALAGKAAKRAGTTTHFYPFAMFSAPLMPPPDKVIKDIGERRMVNFTGVGISVGEEIDPVATTEGIEEKDKAALAFSNAVYERVCALYTELDAAVKDPTSAPAHFSQPWRSESAAPGGRLSQGAEQAAMETASGASDVGSGKPEAASGAPEESAAAPSGSAVMDAADATMGRAQMAAQAAKTVIGQDEVPESFQEWWKKQIDKWLAPGKR